VPERFRAVAPSAVLNVQDSLQTALVAMAPSYRKARRIPHPPDFFACQPNLINSATMVSRCSPWISMTPSRSVPPDPQRFFSLAANSASSASGNLKPLTVVTPRPALPLVSRPTRKEAGFAVPGVPLGQTHSRTGRRQLGHKLPIPVE
jgi:hypothetical protein